MPENEHIRRVGKRTLVAPTEAIRHDDEHWVVRPHAAGAVIAAAALRDMLPERNDWERNAEIHERHGREYAQAYQDGREAALHEVNALIGDILARLKPSMETPYEGKPQIQDGEAICITQDHPDYVPDSACTCTHYQEVPRHGHPPQPSADVDPECPIHGEGA